MPISRSFVLIGFTLALAGLIAGCDSSPDFIEPEPVPIPSPRDVNDADFRITGSGLKVFDFTVGPGTAADSSLVVEFHYIMWLADDSTFVTSSFLQGIPAVTQLGSEDWFTGMEEALLGMRVGGDRQVVVPSFLAYGTEGAPSIGIPSDANIIVEMALLGVGVIRP